MTLLISAKAFVSSSNCSIPWDAKMLIFPGIPWPYSRTDNSCARYLYIYSQIQLNTLK